MASAYVYVIVHTPDHERAIQPGQPPTQLATYALEVPRGEKSDTIVGDWIGRQHFPPTTVFAVVSARGVKPLVLRPTLEPGDVKPGLPAPEAAP